MVDVEGREIESVGGNESPGKEESRTLIVCAIIAVDPALAGSVCLAEVFLCMCTQT